MKKGLAQSVQDELIELFIERRKKLGLSHEKLAALAGIHRTAVSHIENRRRNPTLLICLKLSQAMDCRLGDLLTAAEKQANK